MKAIEPNVHVSLESYTGYSHLSAAVNALRSRAQQLVPRFHGRTIWMVNSTAEGGGVAELLPAQISLLRQLGLDVRWAVMESDHAVFFALTKRLHNMIHGVAEPLPTADDRALYEHVNREEAHALAALVKRDDILVIHDPQPLALGALLQHELGIQTVWRCHIGVDDETAGTRAAWQFLQPYAIAYQQVVFSILDYVPEYLRDRASVIHPTIDPLSHKNRDLSLHKLVGILSDADLVKPHWPLVAPPFPHRARRLQPDGSLAPATVPDDIGLIARPIVTQVSRWDRLKGFGPLLEAFVLLKRHAERYPLRDERHARRLAAVRLVLAGADPHAIADDPESRSVFDELSARYRSLPADVQNDIAIVTLPMQSRKQNALMVNALQRASDIIVQNSLKEGFGLTVAEAMWKRVPVLGSASACGIRLQVRDGVDGRLAPDPEDTEALARILVEMLADSECLEEQGRSAQLRVYDEFLIFSELEQWLELLSSITGTSVWPPIS